MRIRRAFTLVEMMVILSAGAVVLTTSAALIHRVMRTQTAAWSFFDVERSALRLSDYFRRDVHRASIADIEIASVDDGMFLQLQFPDGQTVEYRQADGIVLRTLSQQESAVSREEFVFHPEIDLSIREENSPHRLILTIVADPSAMLAAPDKRSLLAHMVPVSLQVEACLGRDARLLVATVGQEESK